MHTRLLIPVLGLLALSACGTEAPVAPSDELAGPVFSIAPTPCSLTIPAATSWEEGALSILGATALPAQTGAVTVVNQATTGRVQFWRWDNYLIGRTNGEGDNGTACYAFAFKATWGSPPNAGSWDARVPFAFGTQRYRSRQAIWTPWFRNVGINPVYMGMFATDNGAGDEDPTVGSIEVGDFRAIDGDALVYGVNRPNKVVLQKFNGSSWAQIGRTNGAGDDGDLMSFAVVSVRTEYTVAGGKVTEQTATPVPVVQIDRSWVSPNVTRLSTYIPGQNIGTLTMFEYIR